MCSDKSVLQYVELSKLDLAEERDLVVLRNYLYHENGVENFFYASERSPWDEVNRRDMVNLSSGHLQKDILTRWVSNSLIHWLHEHFFYRFKVCHLRKADNEIRLNIVSIRNPLMRSLKFTSMTTRLS
jgi:hypothetical protein